MIRQNRVRLNGTIKRIAFDSHRAAVIYANFAVKLTAMHRF